MRTADDGGALAMSSGGAHAVPSGGARHRQVGGDRSRRPGQVSRRAVLSVLLVVALLTVASSVALVIEPGGLRATRWWDDLAQLVCPAIAAVACLIAAHGLPDRRRRTYRLIGSGCAVWALGQAAWSYYELLTPARTVPSPGLPDAGYLLMPALVLGGLVCYPTAPQSRQARARLLLDGIVVTLSLFVLSWATALGEAFHAAADSTVARLVNTAYPASDVVLIVATLGLLARSVPGRRPPLLILIAGLGAVSLSDSSFVYFNAVGTYAQHQIVNVGWCCGFLLVAVAVWSEPRPPQPSPQPVLPSRWQLVLPYPSLVLSVGVLIAQMLGRGAIDRVEVGAGLGLLVAVLVRQFLTLADNHQLVERVGRSELAMRHQAFHDALTGLPNRAGFGLALEAAAHSDEVVGLVYVDLDDFKLVNDTWGHPVGDQLLREVASRLRATVRAADTVSRLGGDEFAVVVPGPGSAEAMAVRLLAALEDPVPLATGALHIRASVGIAERPADGHPDLLLRDADTAMYDAKRRGGAAWSRFDSAAQELAATTLNLRSDLRAALEWAEEHGMSAPHEPGLHVAYQPIVRLADGCPVGLEALARWNHPTRGVVGPDVFVEVAEDGGLIGRLDGVVLREALAYLGRRRADQPELRMSVNISPRHLHEVALVSEVLSELSRAGLPGSALIVEVTESALLADPAGAALVFTRLVDAGIAIALDDFGTGWSSLSRLSELPVSVLKIDRAFVAGVASPADATQDRARRLFSGIVALGRAMGLHVCVEGIETEAQLHAARAAGAQDAQGYLLGRPAPAAATAPHATAAPDPTAAPHAAVPTGRGLEPAAL